MSNPSCPAQVKPKVAAKSALDSSAVHALVVDDDPHTRKLLLLILTSHKFQCTTASSGEEALVALQRHQFDAIISDLCMPGISGLELLAEARRQFPHIAFLVTTGVDDVETGITAMQAGADDYLVKPLQDFQVLASLERSLRKRQLERELAHYRQHLEAMVGERTRQLQEALWQVEQGYEDTLRALGAAIDLRDSDTAGHSRRVCLYSLEIARRMDASAGDLSNVARGAYLHDIGKLGIPDGILLKPGPLTQDEWRLMQQHVQIGFDVVNSIPFLVDAAELILAHHERFDGGGYPRGLKGKQIPLNARIFAISDTLDAITSDRPYHRAAPFESARETIRRSSGSHFDPQVVAVFLSMPPEIWPAIAKHQGQLPGLPSRLFHHRTIAYQNS